MSDTSSSARVAWMDLARVIAAFWVVTIHVAAVPVVHMTDVPLEWWWWANVYNCLSRAAVPLFVMLSGATLLTAPAFDTGRFFKRRAAKLLPPLIAWTFIYVAWRMWLRHDQIDASEVMRHLLDGLSTPAYPHLWFLWIIASLYLLTPLLQPFVARASISSKIYFGALWLITTAVLPLVHKYTDWHLGLLIQQPSFGYVGYYVLGACLCQHMAWRLSRAQLTGCVLVFLIGAGAAACATYALSAPTGQVNESMMEPLSAPVIMMSLSAFVLMRHLGTAWLQEPAAQARPWGTWLARGSALSFGIYLCHPLMLDLLDLLAGLPLDPLPHHTAWYVPLVAILAFASAGLVTQLLRKIPGVRLLVP